MKQLIATMLEWFNIFIGQISIGVNQYAGQNTRHGIAHVRCVNGGITQISIIADDPEKLENPSKFTINSIFIQLTKMGFEPINLEIINKEYIKVYQLGRYRPLMVQPI
jgi:hypothetical protein